MLESLREGRSPSCCRRQQPSELGLCRGLLAVDAEWSSLCLGLVVVGRAIGWHGLVLCVKKDAAGGEDAEVYAKV